MQATRGRADSSPKADTLLQPVGKSLYKKREGAPSRNSTVRSDSYLETIYQWSDQPHLVLSTNDCN